MGGISDVFVVLVGCVSDLVGLNSGRTVDTDLQMRKRPIRSKLFEEESRFVYYSSHKVLIYIC